MALVTFDFPYHLFETVNPDTGFRGQFGGSYIFSAGPDSPDQRMFKLTFEAMKFYTDELDVLDATVYLETNMKRLIDFYQAHKLHISFIYPQPVYGDIEVKFNKPLPEPKGIKGGDGVIEGFEIELVEIP